MDADNKKTKRQHGTGYRGVVDGYDGKTWGARVFVHNKYVYVGWFNSPMEAARAHDIKARELLGDNAELNFPAFKEDMDLHEFLQANGVTKK